MTITNHTTAPLYTNNPAQGIKVGQTVTGTFSHLSYASTEIVVCIFRNTMLHDQSLVIITKKRQYRIYNRWFHPSLPTSGGELQMHCFPLPEYMRVHNNSNGAIMICGNCYNHMINPEQSVMAASAGLLVYTFDNNIPFLLLNSVDRNIENGYMHMDGNNLFIVK